MDDVTWIVWVRIGRVICTPTCLVETWAWVDVDVMLSERENFDVLQEWCDLSYPGWEVITYLGPEHCLADGYPEEWPRDSVGWTI